MPEQNANLWAPWRMEYIHSLHDDEDESCFLCRYWAQPDRDDENHVIWRTKGAFVIMNRFPYTNGHLLVATAKHIGGIELLSDDDLDDMTHATRDAIRVLISALNPQGYNVGINMGRCAGAGVPDHVHTHIVPRWNGDTNYMAVVGDVRVIPQSLDALHARLREGAEALGLLG